MTSSWSGRPTRREGWIVLVWAMVGLGLGLMLLAAVMWWRAGATSQAWSRQAFADPQVLAMVGALKSGHLPAQASAQWAPLWLAMQRLQAQRAEALRAYEQEVQQASPASWVVPEQLVQPEGRQALAQRLSRLDQALQAWTQREAVIQTQFDDELHAWFDQAPVWFAAPAREKMVEASGDAARVLHDYVRIEQDLLTQIRHLSAHIESLGSQVSLSQGSSGQELIFRQQADLNRYHSSVARLGELAEQERELMTRVKHMDQQHRLQVAGIMEAASLPAGP